MKYGLSQKTVERICLVFSRYQEVEEAILYGSRAKGNHKNGSDIDLTLKGGDRLTLVLLNRIMNDLDDLLLPYQIDLSIFNQISDESVVEHIERVGITFYKRKAAENTD